MATLCGLSFKEKAEPSQPQPQERSNMEAVQDTPEYVKYLPLYRALDRDDWETAKNFLTSNPGALTADLIPNGNKALHIAVQAGNADIVKELVNLLEAKDLKLENNYKTTAMIFAATGGIIEIAEHIIGKNRDLISIPTGSGRIPVVFASERGHKAMVRYLYDKTPKEELSPEKEVPNGATLLTNCIRGEMFGVALDLLQHHPELVLAEDIHHDTAPYVLAQTPSAFRSGSTLSLWQRWIYSLISIDSPPSPLNANGDIERLQSPNGSTSRRTIITRGLHKPIEMFCKHLKDLVPAIEHIYELKMTHAQAHELLRYICEKISTTHETEFEKIGVYRAISSAVNHGIVEFLDEIIEQYPEIVWNKNDVKVPSTKLGNDPKTENDDDVEVLTYARAHELLRYICEKISTTHETEFEKIGVHRAISDAVNHGIVEFLDEIIKHHPDIVWNKNDVQVPSTKLGNDPKTENDDDAEVLTHARAHELLRYIREIISTTHETEFEKIGVYRAISSAVNHGIVDFLDEIIKHHPDIVWNKNGVEVPSTKSGNDPKIENDKRYQKRSIFFYAAAQRQEKIFSLIYRTGARKSSLATVWENNNNMLHQVALIPSSSRLDRVSGPALQMQRELQWFKEVERIVPPKYKETTDKKGRTPRALFTEQHKDLKKEGEAWMKKTAETSIVVAALIVTIMFAAALTVPGGYDDVTGLPRYMNRISFTVFIISDAISLIASSTSLLMFLGILTAQYKEEDFHTSLPTKLLVGLFTLFSSIPTMMINFGITIFIVLNERVSWVSLPIMLLGILPVTIFAVLQFPLLLEISWSTYGPGIFDKPKKRWFLPRKLWNNN